MRARECLADDGALWDSVCDSGAVGRTMLFLRCCFRIGCGCVNRIILQIARFLTLVLTRLKNKVARPLAPVVTADVTFAFGRSADLVFFFVWEHLKSGVIEYSDQRGVLIGLTQLHRSLHLPYFLRTQLRSLCSSRSSNPTTSITEGPLILFLILLRALRNILIRFFDEFILA